MMIPRDDIEALQEENKKLKKKNIKLGKKIDELYENIDCWAKSNVELYDNCEILVKKLLEAKPELEDWIKLNFGEYL